MGGLQALKPLLNAFHVGQRVGQRVGRVRDADVPATRPQAFNALPGGRGQLRAPVKGAVLPVVGIHGLHRGALLLQALQLCGQGLDCLGVVALDGLGVGDAEQLQVVLCTGKGLPVGVPRGHLLGLLRGREIASAGDHDGRAPGADLVVTVDGLRQGRGVPVKQVFGAVSLRLGGALGFYGLQDLRGLVHPGVVAGGCAPGLVVAKAAHLVRNAGGALVDSVHGITSLYCAAVAAVSM